MKFVPGCTVIGVPLAVFALRVNAPLVLLTTSHCSTRAGKTRLTFAVSVPVMVMMGFAACSAVSVMFDPAMA